MKTTIFKVIRNGNFYPAEATENQCVADGHGVYLYEIKLVFGGEIELDERGFLAGLDTAEVDQMIQDIRPTGSCEKMHLQIWKAFCARFGARLVAYKMSIKKAADAAGWIDFLAAADPALLNCF